MKFSDLFATHPFPISFEFFPPKKEENLSKTQDLIRTLAVFEPAFMTVTYGAGGSTRSFTRDLTQFIQHTLQIPAVAHLTCVGHSQEQLAQVLKDLEQSGVGHILALRGDQPKGCEYEIAASDGFSCARDLLRFIHTQGNFSCAVAGYPETHRDASSAEADIAYLKEKVDAGAEVIFTQLFFEADLYFRFREKAEAAGIRIPIVPGIMPIANVDQVTRFTGLCGASIPKEVASVLETLRDDDEAVQKYGQEQALLLAQKLRAGGAPGLHLYTLNRAEQVRYVVGHLN
jgi:methylenetetrahydrofolate reductase (NADPH)